LRSPPKLFAFLALALGTAACAAGPSSPPPSPRVVEYRAAELHAAATGTAAPQAAQPRVHVEGQPKLVNDPEHGPVLAFDGLKDRLEIEANPLDGATEFTVELLIRPADVYPASAEPRVVHIEAVGQPDRRLTVELRLNERREWYVDAFLKAGTAQALLIAPARVHPVGGWQHVAVTYADGRFTSYVNGREELSAAVEYLPLAAHARTSLGARLNRVHYYAGQLALLRFTHAALAPAQFRGLPLSAPAN
jgi:hypothetical protein